MENEWEEVREWRRKKRERKVKDELEWGGERKQRNSFCQVFVVHTCVFLHPFINLPFLLLSFSSSYIFIPLRPIFAIPSPFSFSLLRISYLYLCLSTAYYAAFPSPLPFPPISSYSSDGRQKLRSTVLHETGTTHKMLWNALSYRKLRCTVW